MSIYFTPLHQYRSNFLVDDTAAVYIQGGTVTANDMACFAAWFEVINATAGITALNPATVTVEYTPDDGTTWITLPGTINGNIDGNGADWNIQASATTGVFPPVVRFKFVAPAGESYTVKKIRRIQLAPGLVAPLRSTSSTPLVGFGAVTAAQRTAAMLGSIDELPAPAATGYNYLTSTPFTKSVANDGRAIDVYIRGALATFSAIMQVNYNGASTTPTYSTATPANNKGLPVILTAGDGLAPVAMGTGADSALTQRVTLSTRHEDVTTPVAMRISDGTEFTTAHETYALNTQFVKAAQTLRLPVSAFMCGWDSVNNTRKEVSVDAAGDLQTTVMNFPSTSTGFTKAATPQFIVGNNINGSAGAGYAVGGGALASALKAVHCFDTMGVAVGIYDGDPAGAGVLITIVGPGVDAQVNCPIASGKTVYLRSMETTGGTVNDYFVINFLG